MKSKDDCLFCRIIQGKIPSEKVYEDEHVIGFRDIHPVAKIHLLFIHRNHSDHLNDLLENRSKDLQEIFEGIKIYTEENGLTRSGYRVICNMGPDAGQTVFHTHFHVLSGEKLRWG